MKTTKLFTLASIILIAFFAFTYLPTTKAGDAKLSVYITFDEAVQDPGLVQEMYVQLNADFLQANQLYYTEKVIYSNVNVYITGTYQEWEMFFRYSIWTSEINY